MSLQVCSCGWSKVTSYHGLRVHQGKKGCTPKGMTIPECEQFRFNSCVPHMTFIGPPIKIEHFEDLYSPFAKSEGEQNMWPYVWETHQRESRPIANPPVNREITLTSDLSLQVCSCGWSKFTTKQDLRTHQGNNGCTPSGVRIPESEQFRFNSFVPQLTFTRPPIREAEPLAEVFTPLTQPGPPVREAEPSVEVFPPSTLSEGVNNIQLNRREESRQRESRVTDHTPVKHENELSSLSKPTISEARVTEVQQMVKPSTNNQQHSLQTGLNSVKSNGVHSDVNSGAQLLSMSLAPLTLSTPANPAAAEVLTEATNQPLFQTPPPVFDTTTRARRALDFQTGATQLQQQGLWARPQQKDTERERKEQQLAKERHDRIREDLQLKIEVIERKMAEVKLSSKECKVGLDTEWLEINNVFSDVMRDVEEARHKALQPLEERRHRVKRETQDLVEKLKKETDQLKEAIEELDQNQDLQVSPLACLDDSWKTVTVDTSFSFGTLRSTTSNMIKNIQKKLEKLSSTELRRTLKFAVDVKLDPATAHPFLELSPDGKKVREGGKDQGVPNSSERFDMFGSVTGLNRFTSGKSYWEVEVRNKSGWDLGVARGDANRKGKLSLTPDNGYWVTVHYENEKYAAMATPPASLALPEKPQKVGVFVDYEEGLVSFYNVTAKSHIYSFTGCLFNGEIVPYFSPHLKQNENNSAPLIISAVN